MNSCLAGANLAKPGQTMAHEQPEDASLENDKETAADKPADPARVNPKVLELLVCPLTKKPLEYDEAAQELISRAAGLAFPIKDGIPIMLIDHARALDDDG